MTVIIDGTTGITTPGIVANDANLNGSFYSTIDDDGSISTGTYTPVLTPSNWKSISNAGAFTLAAPAGISATAAYTLIVQITNVTGAGTISTSGFTKVVGDDFTTTVGHVFFVYITVFGTGAKIASVVAAQ